MSAVLRRKDDKMELKSAWYTNYCSICGLPVYYDIYTMESDGHDLPDGSVICNSCYYAIPPKWLNDSVFLQKIKKVKNIIDAIADKKQLKKKPKKKKKKKKKTEKSIILYDDMIREE